MVSCLVLYDMMMARWVKNEKTLDDEDVVELVYRYCREVEHSDVNLEKMDKALDAGKEKYV